MKKRNLNFLLALLAALALVFAGACSDGSDDDGTTTTPSDSSGPSNSDDDADAFKLSSVIGGTTWTYTNETQSGKGVYGVTIVFGESGDVTLTAYGNDGSQAVGSSSTGASPIESVGSGTTYYSSVTYTVSDDDNTVTITSKTASGSSETSLDESAVIVLTLDNDSISAKALNKARSDDESSGSKLTVSEIKVGTTGETAALTVVSGEYTLDILGSEVSGALSATTGSESEFKCTDDGSSVTVEE